MKRYTSIFLSDDGMLGEHLGTFDTKTKRWAMLNHRMKDATGKFEHRMLGYLRTIGLSHNTERWDGPYERNAKGEILQGQIPERLTTEQLEAILQPKPSQRGRSTSSMRNLRPELIHLVRYKPESQFTVDHYTQAAKMRDAGRTWEEIGCLLQCHYSAIKTAMFRRNLSINKQHQ